MPREKMSPGAILLIAIAIISMLAWGIYGITHSSIVLINTVFGFDSPWAFWIYMAIGIAGLITLGWLIFGRKKN